jgi:hypothetical protein
MFKSVTVTPITTQADEELVARFYEDKCKSKCERLRIDKLLYLEPKDLADIDNMLEHDSDKFIQDKGLHVEGCAQSLAELKPKDPPLHPAKPAKPFESAHGKQSEPTAAKAFSAASGVSAAPAKPKEKEIEKVREVSKEKEEYKESTHESKDDKDDGQDLERTVLKTLQSTSFNPRAEAPEEFFLFYSDTMAWVPLFLLYLLILILVNVISPLFS